MVDVQVWTLIGLLATALFTLLVQLRALDGRMVDRFAKVEDRLSDMTTEMSRGFGEIRGDISVLKAQINRDGQ